MSDCSTNKICYNSQLIAEEALIQNRAKYNYAPSQGPINVYQCEICHCYHFTSKGEPNARITSDKNKINRQGEANYWEDKLK